MANVAVPSALPAADGPDPLRSSAGAAGRTTAVQRRLIYALVALASVGGALAGAAPSGQPVADVVLTAAVAAVVTAAASRARRPTLVVLAGIGAVLAGGAVLRLVANAALLAAVTTAATRRRPRLAAAAIAAVAVQVLLRLPAGGWAPRFHGFSALAAAVAMAPVLVSGYRASRSRQRAGARLALGAVAAAVVVAGLSFTAGVVSTRARALQGIDDVRSGLLALGRGDAEAPAQLERAARSLSASHDRITAWWSWPARLTPFVGQQVHALGAVTGEAAELAGRAAAAARDADLAGLRFEQGRFDLERVASIAAPLDVLGDFLDGSGARVGAAGSAWLVPPVNDRLEAVQGQIERARSAVRSASAAARVAPGLLGADGPRRYFVAFVTPAESRGLGGYMGNYGELTADAGSVRLTRSGRTLDLMVSPASPPRPITEPAEYAARYGRFQPEQHLGDLAYSPDFPTVAGVMEQQYERSTGTDVEGAVSIDPYALAALLQLSGPIDVPGLGEPLTAANAPEVLLQRQYQLFPDAGDRIDFLAQAAAVLFDRLAEGGLPDIGTVLRTLGPMVRQGRLMVHSTRPEEQGALARLGLDGAFPAPGRGDFFSLVTQNSANNKIDVFLDREVEYEASFDPVTGGTTAAVDVTLRNRAPAAGLPHYVIGSTDPSLPPGTNRLFVSVYTPLPLEGARLGSMSLPMETQRELGRWVHSGFVTLGPGETVVVHLDLVGRLEAGREYRLSYAPQPMVNPDRVTLLVRAVEGWRVRPRSGFVAGDDGSAVARLLSDGDEVLTAGLVRK